MPPPEDPAEAPTRVGGHCPACSRPLPEPGAACPDCEETLAASSGDGQQEFTGPKQIADYRIVRELGAGGMGTVFEAHESKMNRRVALKVLARHLAPSDKAGVRFEQEAWIAGRLNHPNLVKVYERGTWEDLSYYSMELVRGGSVADVISNMKRWGRDDRLGLTFGTAEYVQWAIGIVIAAARALDYAHRENVVHRDVKPVNMLLSRETGTVKLADFGLAFETDATRMTTEGKVLGTLAFMAPEQVLGKREAIDARTDVYALGVTLFQMLTLELPYRGETQQMYLNAILTCEARRPSRINERVGRDLEIVIRKALEKNGADRYRTAEAFAADLDNVLHYRPILARPPSPAERLGKWIHRRPMHAALLAVLLVGTPVIGLLGHRAVQLRAVERTQRLEALLQEQRWLVQRGGNRELLATTTEILRLDPGNLDALRIRAGARTFLAESTSGTAAADHRARALADVEEILRLETSAAWPYYLKAQLLDRFGREQEATAARDEGTRRRSADPGADDLYFEAHIAHDAGDYESAIELFSTLLPMRPSDTDALAYRAYSYRALDRLEPAIQDFRLAVALRPEDFIFNYNLGQTLTRSGALEEGERFIRRALELAPESAAVYEGHSANRLEQGRQAAYDGKPNAARELFVEAEQAARRSLELEGRRPWALINLGASLMEQNRLREESDDRVVAAGIEYYEDALRILREDPDAAEPGAFAAALANTCDALLQAGRPAEALDRCAEVTEVWPDDAIPFYNLAGAYALLGRADDAFTALERDFELGDRDWEYLAAEPWFESLRADPRFDRLIARMREGSEAAP